MEDGLPEELYKVLGVGADAGTDEIRKAYRTLAKKFHPDLNPGDKAAEETFKKIQAAHAILSDEEKRRQYDAGAIDAQGNERQHGYYHEYAEGDGAHPYQSDAGYADFSDAFSDLFGARARGGQGSGGRGNIRMRGGDVRYTLDISFQEAVLGAKKRVTMPDGKSLDIAIPPGQRDGQLLRLRGKGMPGLGGGAAGDALVEVHVASHRSFRREGNDIHSELPIGLHEAVLGAKVQVPTVGGSVTMTIPKGSNSGDALRLRGKGVPGSGNRPAGDQLVTLRVVLPEDPDDSLSSFLEGWAKDHAYDPRKGKEGGTDA